jgi:hypothetical protein
MVVLQKEEAVQEQSIGERGSTTTRGSDRRARLSDSVSSGGLMM